MNNNTCERFNNEDQFKARLKELNSGVVERLQVSPHREQASLNESHGHITVAPDGTAVAATWSYAASFG
jgi:hypothetical protein